MHKKLTFLVAGAALTACASSAPQVHEHLAQSMAAVRGAEEAGAESVPKAALHLKLAQDQIAQAKNMVDNGDEGRADRMAIRAYNDAELANALARKEAVSSRLGAYRESTPVELDESSAGGESESDNSAGAESESNAGAAVQPSVELREND